MYSHFEFQLRQTQQTKFFNVYFGPQSANLTQSSPFQACIHRCVVNVYCSQLLTLLILFRRNIGIYLRDFKETKTHYFCQLQTPRMFRSIYFHVRLEIRICVETRITAWLCSVEHRVIVATLSLETGCGSDHCRKKKEKKSPWWMIEFMYCDAVLCEINEMYMFCLCHCCDATRRLQRDEIRWIKLICKQSTVTKQSGQ